MRLIGIACLLFVLGPAAMAQELEKLRPLSKSLLSTPPESPSAKFWHTVRSSISHDWYLLLNAADPEGKATEVESFQLTFTVDPAGKTHDVKVLPPAGSGMAAGAAVKAVSAAVLPPPPPGEVDQSTGRTKAYSVRFNYFGSKPASPR